jgi:hypothetical protein
MIVHDEISVEEMAEMALYNKQTLKEVLIVAGYDAEYLFEWGLPSFWKENYWSYPEYTVGLFEFLVKKYSLTISPQYLDSIFCK